ncbi:MAG: T9SS C-terminal target domain-containing protein, partial [Bacteroidota bacterium]
GLIVLGKAPTGVDGNTTNIEGIPSTEGRAVYGGNDPNDNSGVIRYLSIRHGGSTLEANNEINGLTLGGVGAGTVIDFVEVFANLDDGIEWFGGTVSVKHAVVSFCGDDSFDYDQSWDGNGQYWFGVQDELSNRTGEWDGSEKSDLTPKANPIIANGTFIGAGPNSTNDDGNDALRIRDDGSAMVYNSVFTSFAGRAIVIDNDNAQDSYQRYLQGDLTFNGNLFFDFGAGSTFADIITTDGGDDAAFIADLNANGNSITNPELGGISRTPNGGLDPRLDANSPALSGAVDVNNSFIDPVGYRGAFTNNSNWAEGWTALDEYGFFGELVTVSENVVTIAGEINTQTWSPENTYLLDGFVFVNPNQTLTILPGTVIKGKEDPSNNDNASALVISRDAKIIADGTSSEPIIFTAEKDDLTDPFDLTQFETGLWGGLILLGNAPLNSPTSGSNGSFIEDFIEGIPENRSPLGTYGGNNPADDSGIVRYVSIRHGGAELIENEEINGLTLGGVGSGTLVDYVEVYANDDDGIEWFGGTCDVKHAIVAYVSDDAFDYDQGSTFKGQFWLAIAANDAGSNRIGEHDGATSPESAAPFALPNISNVTYIGKGVAPQGEPEIIVFRDNAGGRYVNSVFCESNTGIRVELN